MAIQTETATPRLHVARSRARLKSGEEVCYAYLRYSVWDEAKGRYQPKQLASLGRTDEIDDDRLNSLEGFLKEWLKKDSSLPFDALQERFKAAEPAFRILCSRDFGLRWVVEQAWEELGYKEALAALAEESAHQFRVDIAIFAMVLVQLVAPRSKRGAARWQGAHVFFPEGRDLQHRHLYAAMDALVEGYEHVERRLKERLDELGRSTSQLSHDTTTLSFAVRYDDAERAEIEADRQARGAAKRAGTVNSPPMRMRGHSKSKRRDLPQVVLEALMDDNGLIVHHATHPGNTSDSSLTPDTVDRLQELGYRDVLWAGDSGTNSVKNRQALRAADFTLVLGEGTARTKVVREVLRTAGRYHPHPDHPDLSYKCVVAEATDEGKPGSNTGPCRLYVVRRNRAEEEHAKRRIAKHIAKIEGILANGSEREREALLHHQTYRRYVRPEGRFKKGKRPAGRVLLDRNGISTARLQAGKSVIACDDCTTDPIEADDTYRVLYQIERVFRRLKSTLKVGPIRHRRADRICGHVMIGVMAHNLGRWLELKAGKTLESLQSLFDNLRVQQVEVGEHVYWQCVELETAQRKAIRDMGYTLPPTRFTVKVDPLHQTT